jgi:hypothetical protein
MTPRTATRVGPVYFQPLEVLSIDLEVPVPSVASPAVKFVQGDARELGTVLTPPRCRSVRRGAAARH